VGASSATQYLDLLVPCRPGHPIPDGTLARRPSSTSRGTTVRHRRWPTHRGEASYARTGQARSLRSRRWHSGCAALVVHEDMLAQGRQPGPACWRLSRGVRPTPTCACCSTSGPAPRVLRLHWRLRCPTVCLWRSRRRHLPLADSWAEPDNSNRVVRKSTRCCVIRFASRCAYAEETS